MASEIKVVILWKDNRGTVGIQSPECDPLFSTIEGDLVTVAAELPQLVEAALVKFTAAPRNPPANLPEPPPPPPVSSAPRTSRVTPIKAKDETRPSMF